MKKRSLILTIAATTIFGSSVIAQKPKAGSDDPFVKKESPAAPKKDEHPWAAEPVQVGILVEWIETDARTANKLVRKHAGSKGVGNPELREELEAMIDNGGATLAHFDFVKTRTGQRAKVESIDEVIYATEYDPAEIPQTLTLREADSKATPANPTSFDVRNVGQTTEVDPVIGEDHEIIEVNIAPEWVVFEGRDYTVREGSDNYEIADLWQPKFFAMKATTAVTVRDGIPVLISTQRPKAEDKMLFLFVQANIVR